MRPSGPPDLVEYPNAWKSLAIPLVMNRETSGTGVTVQ